MTTQALEGADQLSLFGAGAVDLVKLRAQLESLPARPKAKATLRSYAFDWRSFTDWCSQAGRCSLPASPETVQLYTGWSLIEDRRKTTTALRRISSITDHHREAGEHVPDMSGARRIVNAIRRERREQPEAKKALAVPDLVNVAEQFDVSTVRGKRNRAIVVLGFATSLRRSTLAMLLLSDIKFKRTGFTVRVNHEKTDQLGVGRMISIWPGSRRSTDPVRVMRDWIEARGDWEGPLFCRLAAHDAIVERPIREAQVAAIVKRSVAGIGLDSALYAAHSLRSGAITASANIGRSDQEIMELSGHKTPAVMRSYIRREGIFTGRNPLEGVL